MHLFPCISIFHSHIFPVSISLFLPIIPSFEKLPFFSKWPLFPFIATIIYSNSKSHLQFQKLHSVSFFVTEMLQTAFSVSEYKDTAVIKGP